MDTNFLEKIVNGVYYVDVWGFDHSDYALIVEYVQRKKIHKIVFLMPCEYNFNPFFADKQSFEIFVGFLKYYNVELKCIVGSNTSEEFGYRYELKDKEQLVPWETWFAHQVISHALTHNINPYGIGVTPHKHFTSLNGRAHKHRVMFLDYMYHMDLFKNGYVSYHNFENRIIDDYEFKWWTPVPMKFDKTYEARTDGLVDILTPPKQFKDSVFSVICESTTQVQFITEKTYVPIYHRRPFLIYGHPHANAYMKSLGFEIFDELIDYSFDSIEDDELRCQAFMIQVKKLTDIDRQELKNLLKYKIHHNWNHMLSIVENRKTKKRMIKHLQANTNHFHLENQLHFLNISDTDEYRLKMNFLKENYENIINRI